MPESPSRSNQPPADADAAPSGDEAVMIARQPIFDRASAVYGYELLFRSTLDNKYACADPRLASAHTIARALHWVGLNALVNDRKAFINFTVPLIQEELYCILPRERCVIELLESAAADPEALGACRKLKDAGYALALDTVIRPAEIGPLFDLVDYVKLDFRSLDPAGRPALIASLLPSGKTIVAEKVETREELAQATEAGCQLVQGYFFCKPELMVSKGLAGAQVVYMEFLRELNRPQLCYDALERTIKRDGALAFKLLRFLNSAGMGIRNPITSIRHALTMLGEKAIRKWGTLAAMTNIGRKRANELLITCLIRAHFCERCATAAGLAGRELEMFMVGLLSSIDALLDMPMEYILDQMAITDAVRQVLMNDAQAPGEMKRILAAALACERGAWGAVMEQSAALRLTQSELAVLYYDAMNWADQTTIVAAAA